VRSGDNVNLDINAAFTVAPADDALFAQTNQAMTLEGEQASEALLDHAGGSSGGCAKLAGGTGIAGALAAGFCQAGGWVEASGSRLDVSGAFGAGNAGFLAGVDRLVGAARLGLAVGYDDTDLTDKAGGKAGVGTVRLGIYGALPVGALVLSGDVMDGLSSANFSRNTEAGYAASEAGGNVFAGAVQVAMPMRLDGVLLQPAAGLDFAHVSTGGFAETAPYSAFAVHTAASGGTGLRPYARVAVSQTFVTASQLVVTPTVSLGVSYQTGDAGGGVRMTTQDGSGFSASAPQLNGAAAQVMAGVSAARGNFSVTAKYEAELAGNWASQSVEAEMELKF
jgi:hypothetical protein